MEFRKENRVNKNEFSWCLLNAAFHIASQYSKMLDYYIVFIIVMMMIQ